MKLKLRYFVSRHKLLFLFSKLEAFRSTTPPLLEQTDVCLAVERLRQTRNDCE